MNRQDNQCEAIVGVESECECGCRGRNIAAFSLRTGYSVKASYESGME